MSSKKLVIYEIVPKEAKKRKCIIGKQAACMVAFEVGFMVEYFLRSIAHDSGRSD